MDLTDQTPKSLDDILEHFGTKGMKWGVRNDTVAVSGVDRGRSPIGDAMIGVRNGGPAPSKQDIAGLTSASSDAIRGIRSKEASNYIVAYNNKMTALTGGPGTSGWTGAHQSEYDKHMASVMETHANKALKKKNLTSSVIALKNGEFMLAVGSKEGIATWKKDFVAHADNEVLTVTITPIRDDNGLIVGFPEENDLAQSEVADILEHFGVKGMHWGVSTKGNSSVSKPPKHPINPDAANARRVQEIVKKHGTSAVSSADLKALNARLNLEQNYAKMVPKKQGVIKKGAGAVGSILANIAKTQATSLGNAYAADMIKEAMGANMPGPKPKLADGKPEAPKKPRGRHKVGFEAKPGKHRKN
jgi:uncharacterized Fe-S cluster protein YjdI